MGTDTDTTVIVPGIVNNPRPARGVRLRLQFDDRELLVDERHSSITIGRAENNDVVVKGQLISRDLAQTTEGAELFVHRDSLQLKGQGMIGLGRVPVQDSAHTIRFTC